MASWISVAERGIGHFTMIRRAGQQRVLPAGNGTPAGTPVRGRTPRPGVLRCVINDTSLPAAGAGSRLVTGRNPGRSWCRPTGLDAARSPAVSAHVIPRLLPSEGTSMSVDNHKSTPQVHAPRTAEQLVAGATSGQGLGYARRSARGHGYELRGLSYVPVSRLHEGRFWRMFRLPPFVPSDEWIAQ